MADKGLKSNVVGLFGGTMLGISSVAPAYALTATLGILAASVSAKTPVVIIAGFLPMFFAAYAYREFNRVMPDAGTSFTWTSKAFGPYIGWIGGWAAVVATISGLWENKLINVATCLVFLAIATYIAFRGIDTTEHVQIVLVLFQLAVLLLFSILAIAKSGASEVGEAFSWAWFSPAGLALSSFVAGLSGSIFAFWGWDTALTVNEESKNSDTTPGRAALLCVLSILLTYLLVTVATQMYAGLGDTGLGLTNPDVADNVFGNLAVPVLGHPLDLALFAAVLASSAASLITTFLPTSRTLLAMGVHRA